MMLLSFWLACGCLGSVANCLYTGQHTPRHTVGALVLGPLWLPVIGFLLFCDGRSK